MAQQLQRRVSQTTGQALSREDVERWLDGLLQGQDEALVMGALPSCRLSCSASLVAFWRQRLQGLSDCLVSQRTWRAWRRHLVACLTRKLTLRRMLCSRPSSPGAPVCLPAPVSSASCVLRAAVKHFHATWLTCSSWSCGSSRHRCAQDVTARPPGHSATRSGAVQPDRCHDPLRHGRPGRTPARVASQGQRAAAPEQPYGQHHHDCLAD